MAEKQHPIEVFCDTHTIEGGKIARGGHLSGEGELRPRKRGEHPISVAELARRCEVSPQLLSRIVNGHCEPSIETLRKIREVAGQALVQEIFEWA